MLGHCAKQKVKATLITTDGERFVGYNYCRNPQTSCPRDEQGYKSGQGYHLCNTVCDQVGHAEVVVIDVAGDKANGATIFLEGHSYACQPCKNYATENGVTIKIEEPPEDL